MPEGDTVHKVADALRPYLEGQVLRRVEVRPGPRSPVDAQTAARLPGRRVEAVRARGKHLLIEVEGGIVLRSHLGMHGSWHRYRPQEPWRKPRSRASLVLGTDREALVCFNAREVECLRSGGLREADFNRRLGPDLLSPEVAFDEVLRRARELLDSDAPLVDVLLDQRVAAGIGNVYKSEVLFLEGLHPAAPLDAVAEVALRKLFRRARGLMTRNLGRGPRVTRFQGDGRGRLWVYGRGGQACLRCGTPVAFARLGRGLRSTYWCPRCQPGP